MTLPSRQPSASCLQPPESCLAVFARRTSGLVTASLARSPLVAPTAMLLAAFLAASPAIALDYLNITVQPDQAVPAACLSFSGPLPRGRAAALEPYVAITPALDHALQPRGKDLCVTGFRHAQSYEVRLKAGLPGADGTTLAKDVVVALSVPDRQRQVSFDQGKTLLPLRPGVGLPLKSVNVATAHLTLYRFSDRALVDHLANDWFGQSLGSYDLDQVIDRTTKVYEGTLAINPARNEQVTTTIPLDGLIKTLLPGVYVAVATSETDKLDRDVGRATQWFSVSDIGLATVKTDAGMLVVARSLGSAQPLPGVELRLVSRANEVLTRLRTDAFGRATITAGLLRGEHGDAPKILAAEDGAGGFTWLQLDAPALDLSDLDVKGRAPPGAADTFLWTDRGVYRPGETIHLGALLRDSGAHPVTGVPVTIHVVRPDGIEVEKKPLAMTAAGGGTLDLPVADNAFSGSWRLWASAGSATVVGETSVSVQDFVPPRLEANITVPNGPLAVTDGTAFVDVAADYFYGSPGADLSASLEATLRPAAAPFKGYEGYRFGLVEEPFLPKAFPAETFTTDAAGKAVVELKVDALPDTSTPLEIALRATVNDVDGRPATAEATAPLHTADHFIGLRPTFADLPDGGIATFEVAARRRRRPAARRRRA